MNNLPDYGKSFGLWRASAPGPWHDYSRHAFVEGLKEGTLPRASFLHYLVQDYVFLIHFARAWALAVVKSETREEMMTAAGTVDALVNHEMKLHVEICAREGIAEETLFHAVEEPQNLAYTRYVMDAGLSGDFLDLMAALAPCVFGYGEIGLRLKVEAAVDTPYRQWIDTYADEDYQAVCRSVGAMIDGAVARRLGNDPTQSVRWARLCDRFRIATELEVSFWQMGLEVS